MSMPDISTRHRSARAKKIPPGGCCHEKGSRRRSAALFEGGLQKIYPLDQSNLYRIQLDFTALTDKPAALALNVPWPHWPFFHMNPSGRSMFAKWSSPVTGFLNVSPRPSPTPSALNTLLGPLPSMAILAFTKPVTSKVGPRICQGMPPSFPVKICASDSICFSVADGSTTKTHLPLPS